MGKPVKQTQLAISFSVGVLFLLLLYQAPCRAQKEGYVWTFGDNALLDFNQDPPQALNTSAMQTPWGCASMSDADGNLLFYSNGEFVWDASHQLMPNGLGIGGNRKAFQSTIITFDPGSPNRYYIFAINTHSPPNPFPDGPTWHRISYSVVDMTLNGGMGDVVLATKGTFLADNLMEGIAAVRKVNGSDYWIVSHEWNSNVFHCFSLDPTGVNHTAVSSAVGGNYSNPDSPIKASPPGDKLAISHYGWQMQGGQTLIWTEVFDFDKISGVVSNVRHLPNPISQPPESMEFSPTGRFFYVLEKKWNAGDTLRQYDLTYPSTQAMISSRFSLQLPTNAIAMQLAVDGKIYIGESGFGDLSTIDQPDSLGAGMNFNFQSLTLHSGSAMQNSFPNFDSRFFLPQTRFSVSRRCVTDTAHFHYLGMPPDSVKWNFGDPQTGVQNSSSQKNPEHQFTDSGYFEVELIAYFTEFNNVLIDTFADSIYIKPLPVFELGNDTILCEGDSLFLTLEQGEQLSYLWQDGSTDSTIQVLQPGQYWVQVSNECGPSRDTITIDSLIPALIHFGPDTIYCVGTQVILDASIASGSYQWHDASMDATFSTSTSGTYWCEASNSCGIDRDTISLFFVDPPSPIDLGSDTFLCSGNTLLLEVLPDSLTQVVWSDSSSGNTLTVDSSGHYSVTAYNQCEALTDSVQFIAIDSPQVDLGADTILCPGGTLSWTFDVPHSVFLWQDGSANNHFLQQGAGKVWLQVSNFCAVESDTIQVDFQEVPTVALGPDTAICAPDVLSLRIDTPFDYFAWSTGENTPQIEVREEGRYSITVLNRCGKASDSIFVHVREDHFPGLGPDQTICPGEEVKLVAHGDWTRVQWQDNSKKTTYVSREPEEVRVTVWDELGCRGRDTAQIVSCPVLWVPNAFTPDQNQQNDRFRPVGENLARYLFRVYDRWGELLYSTTNPADGWDGTYHSLPAPQGAYVWEVVFVNEQHREEVRTGSFVLIR